jgi:Icc-related predicted phosphoesterase
LIRIAAAGDVHFGPDSAGSLRPHLEHLGERADLLLLAGDLTRSGAAAEARVLAAELAGLTVPVLAVLGNHDHHQDQQEQVRAVLEAAGIRVLEGETATFSFGGRSVGVAGVKGFGGGFAGACATEFGELEMKVFVRHSHQTAESLEAALRRLETEVRVALVHYAPVEATLEGERLELYPLLGSYLLADAADRAGADLIVHGHAHGGQEKGCTPGGIPVRNAAQPVIRRAYALYTISDHAASRRHEAALTWA